MALPGASIDEGDYHYVAPRKARRACPAPFSPQAQTLDKGHGRIEGRALWAAPADPKTVGLAGVAQVVRIHCHTEEVRQGQLIKQTDDVRFAVTSCLPEEADPQALLALARGHCAGE